MRFLYLLMLVLAGCFFVVPQVCADLANTQEGEPDVEVLIGWLLEEGRELERVRFADVIRATAGKEVLPVDLSSEEDVRILRSLEEPVRRTLAALNGAENPVHQVGRINEVSGYIEVLLVKELDAVPGLQADFPRTAAGRSQRSGYPDIRVVDEKSGRVFYLDPKLYAIGSERSTFRTFYFEPKTVTNKVLDDAVHLILGIAHGGRRGELWTFLNWRLIDLADFEVRLKAEFQGSNRDLYRPGAVVAEGEL